MTSQLRLLLSRGGLAALTAALCAAYSVYSGTHVRPDFDQFYGAARALLAGRDVYASVGPGRWFPFDFPFFYPLPAAMVALPFAAMPVVVARAVFSALCGGILALALTRDGTFTRAPALLSFSMLTAIQYGQLAPLLAAGIAYPWLAGIVAVKPSTGLAVLAAQRRRRDVAVALGIAAVLTLASFVVRPAWLPRWLETVRTSQTLTPMVLRWGGVLLLLSLLRLHVPSARWMSVMAIVPVTSPLYESLPLFMAPLTFRRALILALLTHAAGWLALLFGDPGAPFVEGMGRQAVIAIVVVYIPALWWLLREPTATRNARRDVA